MHATISLSTFIVLMVSCLEVIAVFISIGSVGWEDSRLHVRLGGGDGSSGMSLAEHENATAKNSLSQMISSTLFTAIGRQDDCSERWGHVGRIDRGSHSIGAYCPASDYVNTSWLASRAGRA